MISFASLVLYMFVHISLLCICHTLFVSGACLKNDSDLSRWEFPLCCLSEERTSFMFSYTFLTRILLCSPSNIYESRLVNHLYTMGILGISIKYYFIWKMFPLQLCYVLQSFGLCFLSVGKFLAWVCFNHLVGMLRSACFLSFACSMVWCSSILCFKKLVESRGHKRCHFTTVCSY